MLYTVVSLACVVDHVIIGESVPCYMSSCYSTSSVELPQSGTIVLGITQCCASGHIADVSKPVSVRGIPGGALDGGSELVVRCRLRHTFEHGLTGNSEGDAAGHGSALLERGDEPGRPRLGRRVLRDGEGCRGDHVRGHAGGAGGNHAEAEPREDVHV